MSSRHQAKYFCNCSHTLFTSSISGRIGNLSWFVFWSGPLLAIALKGHWSTRPFAPLCPLFSVCAAQFPLSAAWMTMLLHICYLLTNVEALGAHQVADTSVFFFPLSIPPFSFSFLLFLTMENCRIIIHNGGRTGVFKLLFIKAHHMTQCIHIHTGFHCLGLVLLLLQDFYIMNAKITLCIL